MDEILENKANPGKKKKKQLPLKPIFFDFWDNLELLRIYTNDEFKHLQDPVRHLIIQILREGIKNIHPVTKEKKIRRALSASELLEIINNKNIGKKISKPVSKANFFFHLNKLIMDDDKNGKGFIKVVGVVEQGRRQTSYYGRTAKIFLSHFDDEAVNYSLIRSNDFKTFLQRINPDAKLEDIEEVLSKVDEINKKSSMYFSDWIKKFENDYTGLNIDFIQLIKIIDLIHQFNSKTIEGLTDLATLLHIDISKLDECCEDDDN